MAAELVATQLVSGQVVDIFGCYDPDTPPDRYEFYDVHLAGNSEHLNLGEPFYDFPDKHAISDLLNE